MVAGFDPSNHLVKGDTPEHHGKLLWRAPPPSLEVRGWVYVFLFPKALLVATYDRYAKQSTSALGKQSDDLTLDTLDPLSSITVRSLPDTATCQHSFVIESPEPRVFSCTTGHEARTWKDVLRAVMAVYNGQSADDVELEHDGSEQQPERWLTDAPGELEVFIAQRAFKDAVELASEAKRELEELEKEGKSHSPELKASIEERVAVLVTTLCVELDRPTLRRQAIQLNVQLLLQLGESERARRKFLSNRELMIRRELRKLKIESSTELYMRKHASKYFGLLKATCKEFAALFDDTSKSGFMKWMQTELQHFADVFYRQVFQPSTNFDTIAECIDLARYHCKELTKGSDGMDLDFHLLALLARGTTASIDDEGRRWNHDVAAHLEEHESWKPYIFRGKVEKQTFLEKMAAAGVATPAMYCYDAPADAPAGSTFLLEATQLLCETTHKFISSAARMHNPKLTNQICSFVEILIPRFMQDLAEKSDGGAMYSRNATVVKGAATRAREILEKAANAQVPALREVEASCEEIWDGEQGDGTV